MKHKISLFSLICVCALLFGGCRMLDVLSRSSDTSSKTEPSTAYAPKELGADEIGEGYNNLSSENARVIYENISLVAEKYEGFAFNLDFIPSEKDCSEAFYAYKNDHPEVFWLDNTYEYIEKTDTASMRLIYTLEKDELASAKAAFESRISEIVTAAPVASGEFEIERYLNDYLCDNCVYDFDAAENGSNEVLGNESTAYGAIVEGKALCEGYARAFQLLCNRLGIECVGVYGVAQNMLHQWNCVKIYGDWYHIDVTWNDAQEEEMYARNCYFNITEEQIKKDHTITPLYKDISEAEYKQGDEIYNLYIPKCTSVTYNYFKQTCVSIGESPDEDAVVESLARAIENGEEYCRFYIDGEDYTRIVNNIMENLLYTWVSKANDLAGGQRSANPMCRAYQLENYSIIEVELDYS